MPFLEEIRFLTQGLMIKLKKKKIISILVPSGSTRVRNQIIWFLTQGFITGVYGTRAVKISDVNRPAFSAEAGQRPAGPARPIRKWKF